MGPRAPAEAAVPMANLLEYPRFSISGMVMDPMAATVAGPDPEAVAKSMDAKTVTAAMPPGTKPMISSARSMRVSARRLFSARLPRRMKKGMARRAKLLMPAMRFWGNMRKDSFINTSPRTPEMPREKPMGTSRMMRRMKARSMMRAAIPGFTVWSPLCGEGVVDV